MTYKFYENCNYGLKDSINFFLDKLNQNKNNHILQKYLIKELNTLLTPHFLPKNNNLNNDIMNEAYLCI